MEMEPGALELPSQNQRLTTYKTEQISYTFDV